MDKWHPADVPDIFSLVALDVYNAKHFYWDKAGDSVILLNSTTGLYDRWCQILHSEAFRYIASSKNFDAENVKINIDW